MSRAAEIQAALESAEADLDVAQGTLGVAIADADEQAATEARAEVERLQKLSSELRTAFPIAQEREREIAEQEAAERQREQNRSTNAQRKRRIEAAQRVDEALSALGRAYDEYEATAAGGSNEDRLVVARRSKAALAMAMAFHALPVTRALGVQAVPGAQHRRGLAETEQVLMRELPE